MERFVEVEKLEPNAETAHGVCAAAEAEDIRGRRERRERLSRMAAAVASSYPWNHSPDDAALYGVRVALKIEALVNQLVP